jgi:membrane protein YdbS with pleckstrin-like domain
MADSTPRAQETPTPYGFDLDPGENIDRVIHRHVVTLLPSLAGSAALILLALLVSYTQAQFANLFPFPPELLFILSAVLLVLGVLFLLVGIYVFRRNVLIFTNVHLIISVQNGLFNHRISQIAFVRVQDVSGSKRGIGQTVLNYGTVEIQSAGEEEKFEFSGAPNPQHIADDVLEIHEQCLRRQGLSEPE